MAKKEPPLRRMKKTPIPPFANAVLPMQAIFSALLLFLALLSLLSASGMIDWLKCALIAASAGVTAYAINRYALEKGALQAAIGSMIAAIVSVASILLVGAGLAIATYAGLVIDQTERLRLSAFGREFAAWTDAQELVLGGENRVAAVLDAIESDLAAKAACEIENSCVSGNGFGGVGPAARQLNAALGSVRAVQDQLDVAANRQANALGNVAALQGALQGLFGAGNLSGSALRAQVEELLGAVPGALAAASAASPHDLISGLAAQLQQYDGPRPQDRLLHGYGTQLARAIGTDASVTGAPVLPPQSGVSDALRHIWHFLPVAMLVAVIEMILPITLFTYTFVSLRARLEQEEREERESARRARKQSNNEEPEA